MSQAASSAASAIDYGTTTKSGVSGWVVAAIVIGAVAAVAWFAFKRK